MCFGVVGNSTNKELFRRLEVITITETKQTNGLREKMAARQGTVSLIESGRGQIICHYTLSLHEQIDVITCDSAVNAGAARGEGSGRHFVRAQRLFVIDSCLDSAPPHSFVLSHSLSLSLFLSPWFPALNCSTVTTE